MSTPLFNPKHRSSMCTDIDWNEFLQETGQEADIIPEVPVNTGPEEPELTAEEIGRNLFNKIDDKKQGFIDKAALRRYTLRQLKEVSPNTVYNEEDFLAGFRIIDTDSDGKITLTDLIRFSSKQMPQ